MFMYRMIGRPTCFTPTCVLSRPTIYFPLLLEKVIKELQAWKNLPLSLFGRAYLFKMDNFAKLLYPLQTIQLMLHTKDINKIKKTLVAFLWRGSRPKIAMKNSVFLKWRVG